MAFDIKVDCKIVLQRLHYGFSQSWYLFILEFAPAERELTETQSRCTHASPTTQNCFLGIPKHSQERH